ncbi:hypothetical protein T492DRAFT_1125138, partial [Pavlovales sp. CCMP2436]
NPHSRSRSTLRALSIAGRKRRSHGHRPLRGPQHRLSRGRRGRVRRRCAPTARCQLHGHIRDSQARHGAQRGRCARAALPARGTARPALRSPTARRQALARFWGRFAAAHGTGRAQCGAEAHRGPAPSTALCPSAQRPALAAERRRRRYAKPARFARAARDPARPLSILERCRQRSER